MFWFYRILICSYFIIIKWSELHEVKFRCGCLSVKITLLSQVILASIFYALHTFYFILNNVGIFKQLHVSIFKNGGKIYFKFGIRDGFEDVLEKRPLRSDQPIKEFPHKNTPPSDPPLSCTWWAQAKLSQRIPAFWSELPYPPCSEHPPNMFPDYR